MKPNNYLIFDNPGILCKKVMYIDTTDFSADKIFQNMELQIKRLATYQNNERGNYLIIMAKIRKEDIDKFVICMEQLQNNNLIIGNTDYVKDCTSIMKEILKNGRQRR